jgi:hypothetical protein
MTGLPVFGETEIGSGFVFAQRRRETRRRRETVHEIDVATEKVMEGAGRQYGASFPGARGN